MKFDKIYDIISSAISSKLVFTLEKSGKPIGFLRKALGTFEKNLSTPFFPNNHWNSKRPYLNCHESSPIHNNCHEQRVSYYLVQVLPTEEQGEDRFHKIKRETETVINVDNSLKRRMRSFLSNKNICLYYWLKKGSGRTIALQVANTIEKVILIFGRGWIPHGRVSVYKRLKQFQLMVSIKKSILIWKLINYTHSAK